jgi:2-polyprenyl-6-methoxyphenol hydroxylase-like FAD-dependent oxidoreductase
VTPFLQKALGWTAGRSFFRGRQILEFLMPDSPEENFRPMYNIQQQLIEQYLWDAVAANDLIETHWQSAVEAIEDVPGGVRLSIAAPTAQYAVEAEWCLACDGARSSIRALRGLRLNGSNFEGRYVIADMQMDHDYPTIRRALFEQKCRPGGTVLIHRQPDNIWRVDYQLNRHETTEAAVEESEVRCNVQAVLDDIGHKGPWDLEWWSVYSANTLALDNYRDGRVFFVGDSAHIVPIFGVRGLNNGLADAANIGWKLGHVLKGRAKESLLDSYSVERRGATLGVFANATKSARFMTPSTHGWRLKRDAALSLALDHPFAAELANPRQMTAYIDSSVVMITLGTAHGLTALEDKDLVFRTAPSDAFQGRILAEVVFKRGIAEVAITHIQNDDGKGLTDAFVARFEELGGKVTGIAPQEGKKASYRSELARLKSGGAKHLLVIAYSADSAPVILRQALEEGAFENFIGVGSLKDQAMFESIGWENLQGMLITEPGAPPDTPAAAAFGEALSASSPDSAGKPFVAIAYDATFLLALAIGKAGPNDRTKILGALREIAGPEGEVVGPGEWEKAKKLIADEKAINYQGRGRPQRL